MEQVDATIEELKIATGWNNISFVGDSLVIKLNIQDMPSIKGLKRANNCLHLEFEDFQHIPISFMVNIGDTVHQYWTLGKQLHRTSDLPAYVAYDPDNDRVIRRWFWNGLLHRNDGPAKEMIKGYRHINIKGMNEFYQESWEYMSLEWYQEGFPAKFPYCTEAIIENGHRIKNKETHRTHSPHGDIGAFVFDSCKLQWTSREPGNIFRPISAEIMDLSELYDDGEFKNRTCSFCEFNWKQGNVLFLAKEHPKFNEEFKNSLLPILDLWGKFYRDEQDEFLVLSEFNRIDEDDR